MKEPPSALVSVVVVNYHAEHRLKGLFDSLRAQRHSEWELIVVDNGSGEGGLAELAAHPGVRVLQPGANVGFGRACNTGADVAVGDHLVFANPDVTLEPDTLEVLVREAGANPDAAVVCPASVPPGHPGHRRENRVEEVAAMPAATMLVPRPAWERLAGFDPWIFLYAEDTDLCHRAWLSGLRVLKAWDTFVWHDVGGSGGGRAWSGEQIKTLLYVSLKTLGARGIARTTVRMALKTAILGVQHRDPGLVGGWLTNLRELGPTLEKRRAVRATAPAERRARLEALAVEHARWSRRAWWRRVRAGVQQRARAQVRGGA